MEIVCEDGDLSAMQKNYDMRELSTETYLTYNIGSLKHPETKAFIFPKR
jgi:hypothetical protein